MARKKALFAVAGLLIVGTALPALALALTWHEYPNVPPEIDHSIDALDIHGSKGVMICDGNEILYTADGGKTWETFPPETEPSGGLALVPISMGMDYPLSCAARREQVVIGGRGFVGVYNTDTHRWALEYRTDPGEGSLLGGIIEVIRGSQVNAEWGIRAVDIRRGQNDNQMIAAGWTEEGGGDPRALVLETTDHGETWVEAALPADWPHINGVICQPTSYLIGPDRFLAEKYLDSAEPAWVRTKYPGVDDCEITGWEGRRDTVWLALDNGVICKRKGGERWESFEVDRGINRMKVAFRSDDHGVVVGNDRHGNGLVYHTTDGGETWTPDAAPLDDWYTGRVEASANENVRFLAVVHQRDAGDHVTNHLMSRPVPEMAPLRGRVRLAQ